MKISKKTINRLALVSLAIVIIMLYESCTKNFGTNSNVTKNGIKKNIDIECFYEDYRIERKHRYSIKGDMLIIGNKAFKLTKLTKKILNNYPKEIVREQYIGYGGLGRYDVFVLRHNEEHTMFYVAVMYDFTDKDKYKEYFELLITISRNILNENDLRQLKIIEMKV